ncbi:hypothetical protein FE697_010230 [Mumia zhuanghuii]|uniref:Uncharacterized protein n=2 Tax=Mumia TaxID=1546255 RepID=A0ABW1QNI5_9ACTN|nr:MULTISPECIES: hypothetical protein [Mumia]KAA1423920.1 hypothetical protein FE697_010230 [Mumia zhuanghuii]
MTITPDEPNPDPSVVPSGDPVPIDPDVDPREPNPDLPDPEIVPPEDAVTIATADRPDDL